MDLNKLKYFLAVAQTEHVTNAANALGISQPALTRSLHRLEQELGVDLIVGEGRNIRLTAEGELLYQKTAQAMRSLDEAERSIKACSVRSKHTIDICIESASALVVEAIARYSREHPSIAFTVSQDHDARLSDIVVSQAVSRSGEERSFTERIGIALPRSSRMTFPQDLLLADLQDAGFICLAAAHGFRKQCDALCKTRGFIPHIIFESDNPSVVRKMIGAGLGVGFWPEHSWGAVESERVFWLPLVDGDFQRTINIDLTPQGIEKRVAQDFRAFLLNQFERSWS